MTKDHEVKRQTIPTGHDPSGGMRSSGSDGVEGGEAARPGQSEHDAKKEDEKKS